MRLGIGYVEILFLSLASPAWSQEAPLDSPSADSAAVESESPEGDTSRAEPAQFTLPATAIAEPYADSAGEAMKICCYAAYCSFWGINECNVLSPEGKVIAFLGMGIGGITGFVAGTSLAVAAYGVLIHSAGPIPVYEVPADELLTISFLNAAAGTVTGAGLGALVGLAYDGTLHFLLPKKKERRARKPSKERPPSPSPVDDPPPAY